MIKLTEVFFSKESLSFETGGVMIDENYIAVIRRDKITMRAPTTVACLIFGDNVPDEFNEIIASTECTSITFKDNSDMNVSETVEQIEELIKNSLPRWKKVCPDTGQTILYQDGTNFRLQRNGYEIDLRELDKLPKED